MFTYRIPRLLQLLAKSYTWKVQTQDKTLFLTFDDGPHPSITPWVLSKLAEFKGHATFFCVGNNVKKFPEVYKMILAAGHTTGNHTFHHLRGWKCSDDDYKKDIDEAALIIQSSLFRPPYGQIKRSQVRQLKPTFRIVMWDFLSGDFDKNLNREKSLKAMKKAGPGSIMVFHDSEKAFDNLQFLLPRVLQFYSDQGYTFKCMPNNS